MQEKTDLIASKFLGKKVEGSEKYDPSLLVAVPRCENRERYGINSDLLPFEGFDIWHAYEFSALTHNGVPLTGLMKLKYSCESDYIIESKSLKLYLNSFNMTKIGKSFAECLELSKDIIRHDLSEKLNTEVSVDFIQNNSSPVEIFQNFTDLYSLVDEKDLKVNVFKEAPQFLETEETAQVNEYYLKFDSLRSNCRVTHQPDFGDLFIFYKSHRHIKEAGLIKYLCSFRSEFHFHEECCEMIYKRLYDLLDGELFVCALYTRRGGIDICPVRYSNNCKLKDIELLMDTARLTKGGIKQ